PANPTFLRCDARPELAGARRRDRPIRTIAAPVLPLPPAEAGPRSFICATHKIQLIRAFDPDIFRLCDALLRRRDDEDER
ncbi:MAG TPA: hypothetical protein VGS13_13495, partial [Stellaceae bacterium]|nr:hypothetical protein [Stellaceae bacterium]